MRSTVIAGWLLLLVGLYLFSRVYNMLLADPPYLFEAGPVTLIGIFVFRGGVRLLEVGAAAQACRETQPREPKGVNVSTVRRP
jgi:hypothetical protein